MTESALEQRLHLAYMAIANAAHLRHGQFSRLAAAPDRLAPIGLLLTLIHPCIRRFVRRDAPRLVDSLRRSTCRVRETVAEGRGGVRGRIDWAATVRARAGDPAGAGPLVCRAPRFDWDQPENRLLVYLLDLLVSCDARAHLLLPHADAALCNGGGSEMCGCAKAWEPAEAGSDVKSESGTPWRMAAALTDLRARLPGAGAAIPCPSRITEEHLRAAASASARLREYRALPEVYRLCRGLILEPDVATWSAAMAATRLTTRGIRSVLSK